jgi:predicted urease superfamily metal-dependent hydrolase
MSSAMEQQPRWAEMCARILQQCESIRGGRENLAAFLGVHPTEVAYWVAAKSGGPSREVFEKAVGIILEEHDRRAQAVQKSGPPPRRRSSDS